MSYRRLRPDFVLTTKRAFNREPRDDRNTVSRGDAETRRREMDQYRYLRASASPREILFSVRLGSTRTSSLVPRTSSMLSCRPDPGLQVTSPEHLRRLLTIVHSTPKTKTLQAALGADHGGFELKEQLKSYLR